MKHSFEAALSLSARATAVLGPRPDGLVTEDLSRALSIIEEIVRVMYPDGGDIDHPDYFWSSDTIEDVAACLPAHLTGSAVGGAA
jgi:hypothetical protein